jgi:hypothetical protein
LLLIDRGERARAPAAAAGDTVAAPTSKAVTVASETTVPPKSPTLSPSSAEPLSAWSARTVAVALAQSYEFTAAAPKKRKRKKKNKKKKNSDANEAADGIGAATIGESVVQEPDLSSASPLSSSLLPSLTAAPVEFGSLYRSTEGAYPLQKCAWLSCGKREDYHGRFSEDENNACARCGALWCCQEHAARDFKAHSKTCTVKKEE